LGGWFGPHSGESANSITAYFNAIDGTRFPGYNSPAQGNIVFVRNWKQRGNLLYIAGNFFNSTNPTTGAVSAIDLTSGEFINQNVGPPGGLIGATDLAIYGNQLISVGEYSSMNGDYDYRYCTSWGLGCSAGSLSIPAAINHCDGYDLEVPSAWSISLPDSYHWEWSLDSGATWATLGGAGAMLHAYDAGIEFADARLRVSGLSSCDTTVSNVATVNVQLGQDLGASITDATACLGSIVAFNAPLAVEWSNGAITGMPMTLNVLGDAIAVATTSSGCYLPDTLHYTVLVNPTLGYTVLDSMNCDYTGGVLLLQGAGGQAPYTYFNPNNTQINAFVPNAASYASFSVRDANYCTAQVTNTIPLSSECYGCFDPAASNYNPNAVWEVACEYLYTSCIYDLSGDGVIGVSDLNLLLDEFGCIGSCTADFDGDQVVGVSDIYFIIEYFQFHCN